MSTRNRGGKFIADTRGAFSGPDYREPFKAKYQRRLCPCGKETPRRSTGGWERYCSLSCRLKYDTRPKS